MFHGACPTEPVSRRLFVFFDPSTPLPRHCAASLCRVASSTMYEFQRSGVKLPRSGMKLKCENTRPGWL